MSDNNINNEATRTPEGNTVEVVEKKTLRQQFKEKKDAFVSQHETGCKWTKRVVKILVALAGGVACYKAGESVGSRNCGSDGSFDMIPVDEIGSDASVDASTEGNNE